jgi:cell wall assembly regulator SMI1
MSVAWLDLLSATGCRLEFRPGCTSSDIEAAEKLLGVSLPASLTEFLRASDGFVDLDSQYEYAWSIKTIVAENQSAWSDDAMRLPDHLLSFGADGAGDWFCLRLDAVSGAVYHWEWMTGEVREISSSLPSFWAGWLRGTIAV